ncbi:hypothetical protein MTR67_034833 [Solanum verrucosum]|uniref:Uncharacterized protein n=1 Tax=Solanum verrucosum TaxID=315347 RepID=A0AAF0ZKV9_SOLVR|nr:hypothetical protein MTR67_034833 [Solanum verrucosum]
MDNNKNPFMFTIWDDLTDNEGVVLLQLLHEHTVILAKRVAVTEYRRDESFVATDDSYVATHDASVATYDTNVSTDDPCDSSVVIDDAIVATCARNVATDDPCVAISVRHGVNIGVSAGVDVGSGICSGATVDGQSV